MLCSRRGKEQCCHCWAFSLSGNWSQHAEEENQRWLTQKYQRCGWTCSRPAYWLTVDQGGGGGAHRSSEARLTVCMQHPPAGWAGLGKLLSLTSSNGVKILRQTLRVNCQIMSSTSPSSLRFHCKCFSKPPLLKKNLYYLFSADLLFVAAFYALSRRRIAS